MEITRKQFEELQRIANRLKTLSAEIDGLSIEVPPEVAAEVTRRLHNRICLACGEKILEGATVRRGLDDACYATINSRIKKGIENEPDLIRAGRITAERKPGGRPAKLDVVSRDISEHLGGRQQKRSRG